MTPVKMRFRTDGSHWADLLNHQTIEDIRALNCYDEATIQQILNTPKAEPGDIWRINWYGGPLAGYAICCPICLHVHHWTTASNCSSMQDRVVKGTDGVDYPSRFCDHNGKGSCWTWTGSAEDNQLTAHPSLHCLDPNCGFHGWLQNGMLTSC